MNNHSTRKPLPANVGHVYVIEHDGKIKIGKTQSPNTRIGGLETQGGFSTSNRFVSFLHEGYGQTETLMHMAFGDKRMIGEWFEVSFDEAVALLNAIVPAAITEERLVLLSKIEEAQADAFLDGIKGYFASSIELSEQCGTPTDEDIRDMVADGWLRDVNGKLIAGGAQ